MIKKIVSFCLKGKINEKGDQYCLECKNNASLNSYNFCECNKGYFEMYDTCIECDDEFDGNPACLASEGYKIKFILIY